MGWGYRKSFKIAPGFRLNVSSKSGLGLSGGYGGLRYNTKGGSRRRSRRQNSNESEFDAMQNGEKLGFVASVIRAIKILTMIVIITTILIVGLSIMYWH